LSGKSDFLPPALHTLVCLPLSSDVCVNILNEAKEYNMPTITILNSRQSKYAICIPVVNEGIRLKKQLLEMRRLRIYKQADIIICDGNSVDGSTDVDFLKQVKVFALIKYPRAHQSEQLLEGFKFVLKHKYLGIITVDGNGKDSVNDIKRFIQELQRNEVDFIQGSRYCDGGEAINTPFIRRYAIKIHVWIINNIIIKREPKFTDTTNGFRAFKTKMILENKKLLFSQGKYSNHAMVYHLLVIATAPKYNYKEIPVKREYPRKGRATKIIPVWGHIELLIILHNLKKRKYDRFY
jgi:dolichol-phosphate mannosyltransferase